MTIHRNTIHRFFWFQFTTHVVYKFHFVFVYIFPLFFSDKWIFEKVKTNAGNREKPRRLKEAETVEESKRQGGRENKKEAERRKKGSNTRKISNKITIIIAMNWCMFVFTVRQQKLTNTNGYLLLRFLAFSRALRFSSGCHVPLHKHQLFLKRLLFVFFYKYSVYIIRLWNIFQKKNTRTK